MDRKPDLGNASQWANERARPLLWGFGQHTGAHSPPLGSVALTVCPCRSVPSRFPTEGGDSAAGRIPVSGRSGVEFLVTHFGCLEPPRGAQGAVCAGRGALSSQDLPHLSLGKGIPSLPAAADEL